MIFKRIKGINKGKSNIKKVAVCKPGHEASPEINPASTLLLSSSLQNCEKMNFYCFYCSTIEICNGSLSLLKPLDSELLAGEEPGEKCQGGCGRSSEPTGSHNECGHVKFFWNLRGFDLISK